MEQDPDLFVWCMHTWEQAGETRHISSHYSADRQLEVTACKEALHVCACAQVATLTACKLANMIAGKTEGFYSIKK